ncbi:hypothetical protein HPB50_018913 [Hyalomma asiaticum]|uniref:Uncharacterized protein n=1 Tax=Hyalomma asiaticum TaxID=266040 RepID=A0ACB7TMH6_HYAAI|nr:hypothetical protein HPB50_018913 [Hyalomma asiaticum]
MFVIQSMRMDHSKDKHSLIEILPNAWLKSSIFILNIYNSSKHQRYHFTSLLANAAGLAAGTPLMVMDDFNAPQLEWGCPINHEGERPLAGGC